MGFNKSATNNKAKKTNSVKIHRCGHFAFDAKSVFSQEDSNHCPVPGKIHTESKTEFYTLKAEEYIATSEYPEAYKLIIIDD